MKILCIIPARSGSKGIKNKNIKMLNGKPLLCWSILQAQKCKFNMKIVVSTDSEKYKNIAEEYGAEVPFLRPKDISGDLSTDYEFLKHCVDWFKKNEKYNPDLIIQLRPTQPNRKIEDIDKAIELFIKEFDNYDSLRSVIPIKKSCFKMYLLKDNKLNPIFKNYKDIKEPYNQCRQILPTTYLHNGYIDILKTEILNNNTISGNKILPYIMKDNDNIDIDFIDDWNKSEKTLII
jgi:CMP-N-acetylneuraminic acid synthetase